MTRILPVAALTLASFIAISPMAFAADEHNTSSGLTAVGAPLGLHGIDPVALLTQGERSSGSAVHAAVHDGVAYYFESEANLQAFTAAPAAFLPENGGFCTFGVSVAKKFDGDPRYAEVIDGKLYVFLNEEIFEAYKQDRDGTISKAADNWPRIRHVAAEEL